MMYTGMKIATDTARATPVALLQPKAGFSRDPRLDFFRGFAIFTILISHTPYNYLARWIPGHFGFSDSAEIFVFCSGMASAIAFGSTFDRHGFLLGAGRVLLRVWQVYWAHIGMFFTLLVILTAIDNSGLLEKPYVETLNLQAFYRNVPVNIVGLFTLTYVPNYFDILPMYLVILAMLPLIMVLSRLGRSAVAVAVLSMWLAAYFGHAALPAEPWSHRTWYFNPFAWQLVFFTGFALMRGWLPKPPVRRNLIIVAVCIVLISIPLNYPPILEAFPKMRDVTDSLGALKGKNNVGPVRYVHFLALAYLAWAAVGEGGRRLVVSCDSGRVRKIWGNIVAAIRKVGQQSLAVFVCCMITSRLIGLGLEITGPSYLTVTVANMIGFAFIILVANVAGWFKAQPWRKPVTAV
jgi:hypothetical protein